MQNEIGPDKILSEEKLQKIKDHIKKESSKQSWYKKLRNKMFSIKFRIYTYFQNLKK